MKSLVELIESKKEVFSGLELKDIEKFNEVLLQEVIKYQCEILDDREKRNN